MLRQENFLKCSVRNAKKFYSLNTSRFKTADSLIVDTFGIFCGFKITTECLPVIEIESFSKKQ